jgi:hypothetical protein
MLSNSRERLARFPSARFVLASFKSPDWIEHVGGPFDCVVSMQAIHELRHKRHAPNLYRQIYRLTDESGQVLICDHVTFDDSAKSIALYMTEEEQLRALSSAGFESAQTVLSLNGLLIYACEKAADRRVEPTAARQLWQNPRHPTRRVTRVVSDQRPLSTEASRDLARKLATTRSFRNYRREHR